MTVMNGSDILEMKRRLKIHCSFLDHKLRNCGSKINLQLQSNPSKFTTRTLEMIYGILQNYDDETEFEIRNCRDQIKTNNKVLGQWLNTVSPDKEDSNTVRTSYEILMAASGNSGERSSSPFPVAVPSISNSKVSSVSLHALYKLSEEMVQLFKSLTKSEPDIAKAAEMLVHSREIRDNLKKKCQEDSKEDKSKENESSSDPITELKKENTKLHESLAEAQDCLKIAHKKLRNHPDSQTICDKILEELGRIKEVMKLTSANVRLLHKKRDLKAIGAAIVE
ncbi:hypothetical protein AB6A40_003018 [Gnathostoma spinigerum]|uniref:Uncharacterized protein n=1 Tax=Gnathostoma spinigerum TaxID=75299 RepID=A0ABD6EG38_9BILA